MKLLGFLLLPSGLGLALASLVLFDQLAMRNLFLLVGAGIQALGFGLIFYKVRRRRELSR